jgi:hypothetical protein
MSSNSSDAIRVLIAAAERRTSKIPAEDEVYLLRRRPAFWLTCFRRNASLQSAQSFG